MPLTIEKTFRFDAGHRALGFHDHKEETLHGHTFSLRLVIEATQALDVYKTIFDTNDLARVVKPLISQLDHSFILWDKDPIREQMEAICVSEKIADKLIIVDFNPTIEGLVEYIFTRVNEGLQLESAVLKRADLDATATLRASYSEG